MIRDLTGDNRSILGPPKEEELHKLVQSVGHIPGNMAEVGVFRGGSAKIITSACPEKVLYLHDTYMGFPWSEGELMDGMSFHETNEAEVKEYLKGTNTVFRTGIFPDTAVDDLYSFVFLDGDLYKTTDEGIRFFLPRLSPGGLMVFDDYEWSHCPGVARAVAEHGLHVECKVAFLAVHRKR